MGIRQEQKEKKRQEILMAGLDLFIHKGYKATKISDIAKAVGMSTGLLFHYFNSKENLYEELIKIGISGPMSVMPPLDAEPIEFLENAARQILHFINAEPFVAKMFVLMKQANYSDGVPQSVKDMGVKFDIIEPTVSLMQKGQQAGTIREGNPYALAIAFWTSIQGIAEAIALYPDSPCPDSEWLIDIIRRKAE